MIRIGNFSLNASGVIIAVWSFFILAFTMLVLADVAIFDHYMFRQTQVATVTRELFNGGPWLAYLMPVLGPPWTAPMEFPVYQILTAELAHLTGLNLELSGRLVSLVSGALGLVFAARALFLAGLGNRESAIALFFIAISPMYFYWSHAVMIETLAGASALEASNATDRVLVGVSSVAGDRGRRSNYVYGAAKGGYSILLQGLAHKWGEQADAPRAITMKLGFVDTPMTADVENKGGPLWATPEMIASVIDRAVERGGPTVYGPWFWRWIMLTIRCTPAFIFNKVNL